MKKTSALFPRIALLAMSGVLVSWMAGATDAPIITGISAEPGRVTLGFAPYPATVEYQIERADALGQPYRPDTTGFLDGFGWTGLASAPGDGFFRVNARVLTPDALLATTLLQRIAYGPSPDDLARVRAIGPDAYIAEQLAPETITEDIDSAVITPSWRKMTVTGTGSSSSLYIYLDGPGEVYLDDIRLVAGTVDDGTKANLLRDGDFETALGSNWILSPNVAGSALTPDEAHGGSLSLHVVSTGAGSSQSTSVYQVVAPALNAATNYTLSYWYLTSPTVTAKLTVRLSGSGITSTHGLGGAVDSPAPIFAKLKDGSATMTDLRAWHLLHAIQSRKQLTEVLRQFWENHFVTEYSKTRDYFDNAGLSSDAAGRVATQLESKENLRWRAAMSDPKATFHDMLKISAESPAMIIYLDTINSKGSGTSIANENFARELCELFCFGVDNGYDQADIVQISRVWTGWSIRLVDATQESNPFAFVTTNYLDPNAITNKTAVTNLVGAWSFNYKAANHNTAQKKIFFNHDAKGAVTTPKLVPARFGPPWAGRDYSLTIPAGTGNPTLQEGHTLLGHMADQPFTQEFLSVKLCRLFVHDGFAIGYDFTDAETTPEEELVHACMLAWENPSNGGPKGQLREVLRTIFSSALFRSDAASLQKVKTPLEFVASAMRALRARRDDGSYTVTTDGREIQPVMDRLGRMRLFDRMEPDGYPEDASAWISAGTLAERIRFVQAALMPAGMTGKSDVGASTQTDPVGLLRIKAPEAMRDSGKVADYFLDLLFPAEGQANLAAFRKIAVAFLDTADDGTTTSAFSALAPGTSAYDLRLRGMVALLMSTQRFQEQ